MMKKILKIFVVLLTPSSASLVSACGAPNGAKINAYWQDANRTYNLYNKDSKINDTTNLTSGVIIPNIDFLNSTVESRENNNNLTKQQISQTLQSQEKTLEATNNTKWKAFYRDWKSNQDFSYSSIRLSYYTYTKTSKKTIGKIGNIDKIKVLNFKATEKDKAYQDVYAPAFINDITKKLNKQADENAEIFKKGIKQSLLVNFSNPDSNKGINFQFILTLTFVGAKNTYTFNIQVKNLTLSFLLIDTTAKKKKLKNNANDDDKPEYQWFFVGYYYVPFANSEKIDNVKQYKPGPFFPHYLKRINKNWGIKKKYSLYFIDKNIVPQPSKQYPFQYLVYQIQPSSIKIKTKNK